MEESTPIILATRRVGVAAQVKGRVAVAFKTGACKFPGRSRWELNFVSEFNVNFLLPSD